MLTKTEGYKYKYTINDQKKKNILKGMSKFSRSNLNLFNA